MFFVKQLRRRGSVGFALIVTMLVGLLFFSYVFSVSSQLLTERSVSNNSTYSQLASLAAEACVSQIMADLRSTNLQDKVVNAPDAYLTASVVSNLVKYPPLTYWAVLSEKQYKTLPNTFYKANIVRIPKGFTDGWDPDAGLDGSRLIYLGVYAMGIVKRGNVPIAQKAVYTELVVEYYKKTLNINVTIFSNNGVFQYGLFSGVDISFSGSSQEVGGSIFANRNIDLGTSPHERVVGGNAYAGGTIVGKGKVSGSKNPNQTPIEFPVINIDYYKALANAFKNGYKPYDGSVPNFPNTADSLNKAVVQYYLGNTYSSSYDAVVQFLNDLDSKTGAFAGLDPARWIALKSSLKNMVFFIDGSLHINGNVRLGGVFVVNGNVVVNGNATFDSLGSFALLVNGNFDYGNGNANVKGFIYTNGSFTGSGSFYNEGGIIAKTSIALTGNFTVKYVPPSSDLLALNPSAGYSTAGSVKNFIYYAEQSPNAWREITVDDFNSRKLFY
ncbi:MAG: hypothetical protein QXE51_00250 [Nitrososphaeria archaeon]